jgi:hypothetical protein
MYFVSLLEFVIWFLLFLHDCLHSVSMQFQQFSCMILTASPYLYIYLLWRFGNGSWKDILLHNPDFFIGRTQVGTEIWD